MLQHFRIHHVHTLGPQGHRVTGSQGHRVTGSQGHRVTGSQGHRVTGSQGQIWVGVNVRLRVRVYTGICKMVVMNSTQLATQL